MTLSDMKTDERYSGRNPMDRMLDGLETLNQYGLEIPVELIDASDEDGTQNGKEMLALIEKMNKIASQIVEMSLVRLDAYREALGQPKMNTAEYALASMYFQGQITLASVEGDLASYKGFLGKFNADASSDLKRALYEGLYDEEV